MLLKILLALRNNAHRVNVIKVNGEARTQLGVSHPEEENRRAAVLRQWGVTSGSPRAEPPATIDEPLPQRTQTILSHRLPPELRQRINTGMGGVSDSRAKRQRDREQADLLPPATDD